MVDIRNFRLPIRVSEDKYVKSSLEDSVYFGKLMSYKQIESQGIGDKFEGKIVSRLPKDKTRIVIKTENGKEVCITDKDFAEDPSIEYELKDDIKEKIGVACFSILTFNDLELYKSSNNKKYFRLKESTLDAIKQYIQEKEKYTGNKCSLIVFTSLDFFLSIKKAGYESGSIQYYDPYDLLNFFKMRDGKRAYCYFKTNNFEYQKEFRIVKIDGKKFPTTGENLNIKGISNRAINCSWNHFKNMTLIAGF